MTLEPSHFTSVLLFASFASTVFGITQRSEPRAMLRYGVYCWVMFVFSVVIGSWVMYFIKH